VTKKSINETPRETKTMFIFTLLLDGSNFLSYSFHSSHHKNNHGFMMIARGLASAHFGGHGE